MAIGFAIHEGRKMRQEIKLPELLQTRCGLGL